MGDILNVTTKASGSENISFSGLQLKFINASKKYKKHACWTEENRT
jgi:hypothetical protein